MGNRVSLRALKFRFSTNVEILGDLNSEIGGIRRLDWELETVGSNTAEYGLRDIIQAYCLLIGFSGNFDGPISA